MKIFVTGSSGFIGSHLITLLGQSHDVHCMASDLLSFDDVKREVIDVGPDIIIHLAARTEVAWSFDEPASFSTINYSGTVNLVDAAIKVKNFKHFIFASTMEVYGWQPISDLVRDNKTFKPIAFDESTTPYPNAPYAVAKLASEKYLEYARRVYDLNYTILRQTNAFGREENDFFVTEHIISQMLKSNDVCLGAPTPYRNFIHIDDVVAAYQAVINNHDQLSGDAIYTLGPDNPFQIKEWANIIADIMKWDGTITWNTKEPRPGEIYYLNSSNDKIWYDCDWEPKVNLHEGLERTVDHWRKKYANISNRL